MNWEVYYVEDREGDIIGGPYELREIEDARNVAIEHKALLVAYIFEFSDSELVEDYTESEEED